MGWWNVTAQDLRVNDEVRMGRVDDERFWAVESAVKLPDGQMKVHFDTGEKVVSEILPANHLFTVRR